MKDFKKLNLGCGNDKLRGFVNADVSSLCNPDIICRLGRDLPFKDNSFEEVRVLNILCQIETNAEFVKAMNELHRITSGFIHIRVPNALDECAFQDPMDCRRFTTESFTYMQHGHRRYEQYGYHYGFLPFTVELLTNNGRQMEFKLCPVK